MQPINLYSSNFVLSKVREKISEKQVIWKVNVK